MITLSITLDNLFQLKVDAINSEPEDLLAYKLLRGNEIVEEKPYSRSKTATFFLQRSGTYRVRVYVRGKHEKPYAVSSERVNFKGLVPTPRGEDRKPIVIAGVSTIAAFAAILFAEDNQVMGFLDEGGKFEGKDFFGYPIYRTPPEGCRLIGHQNYAKKLPLLEGFDLRVGNDNVLSREVNKFGAMDVYRLSRHCFLNGLKEGADYLVGTSLRRFNSRLPYQAKIGLTTTLGVGGMAIAIHPKSIIGENCVISQNVTIGMRNGVTDQPIIGNNVFIGPGAKCLGGKIGDNVVIGANAVVLHEIPSNSVVAGVPARVLESDISKFRSYTHRREIKSGLNVKRN